jgi:hydroxymethylpyrimidine pyrophosphatase-like HAD family hydrolase
MFGAVGFSVAMGNAVPQLRAAADYVTDDVEHDGIAKTLKHLGLIP